MHQQTLFDEPIQPTTQPRRAMPGMSLVDQFRAFHAANPHVYDALRNLALRLRNNGHRRIGMKMLFETLRYQYMINTSDPNSDFKLNNNYTAYYARLLMDNEPVLAGAFETRERRAA